MPKTLTAAIQDITDFPDATLLLLCMYAKPEAGVEVIEHGQVWVRRSIGQWGYMSGLRMWRARRAITCLADKKLIKIWWKDKDPPLICLTDKALALTAQEPAFLEFIGGTP